MCAISKTIVTIEMLLTVKSLWSNVCVRQQQLLYTFKCEEHALNSLPTVRATEPVKSLS